MNTEPPKHSYAFAIICGIMVLFFPDFEPFSIFTIVFYLLLAGALFGFIWPRKSWRWGLWIAGPMVALLVLSVLFAGNLEVFFRNDFPLLLSAIIAACAGSFISAWFKKRQIAGR